MVAPDGFYFPSSYSPSLSSQQRPPQSPLAPSTRQQRYRHEKVPDSNRSLVFSQNYSPKSLIATKDTTEDMNRDVQDLLGYIDNLAFSPPTSKPKEHRQAKALRDRTNKTPHSERRPAIKLQKDPAGLQLQHNTSRCAFDREDILSVTERLRRVLDPEPTLEPVNGQDSGSIVLGTNFADTSQIFQEDSISKVSITPDRSSLATWNVDTTSRDKGDDEGRDHTSPYIATPEDARKLLRTAVSTLQDARAERESARKWAQSMKGAVSKWAQEQRKLVRCETMASEESLYNLEQAIRQLQTEIQSSNQHRKSTEEGLRQLMLGQQDKIHALTLQMASMEKAMGEGRRTQSSAKKAPLFVNKTPKGSSNSTASSRVRRRTFDGGHVIVYGNGVRKEVHKDGTSVIRFANGDVETKFAESGTVAYFHAEDRVMQITTADGSTLFEYPSGQIERHYTDGSKAIIFPDGTKQRISATGHVETLFV